MDDAAPLTSSVARNDLYERDFYAWGLQQAALLRAGRLGEIDIVNVAEEIESLGKREHREIISRLEVLLVHLLKWRFQSDRRGASWQATIRLQRRRISRRLDENPSLRPGILEDIHTAYGDAVIHAAGETSLSESSFPRECPWTVDQIMDETFWPE